MLATLEDTIITWAPVLYVVMVIAIVTLVVFAVRRLRQ
jgi:hypothetical protein